MAAPVVQDLSQLMAELDPAYSQSRNLINQQISTIPGQTSAAVAGLDAAKTNAFRDIQSGANSRGMAFGGIPLEEQGRYLGEKYLPARAQVEQGGQQQQMTLMQALANLEQDRYKTALTTQQRQQSELGAYNQTAEDRAFRAQQAALDRSASASSRAATNPNLDLRKNSQGGWDVYENGAKSTNYDLAGYARATGKDLLQLLAQGDQRDKQAAQWYMDKVNKYGAKDSAKYLEELKRDRSTAFYLGG
jgi:hypothetical protein